MAKKKHIFKNEPLKLRPSSLVFVAWKIYDEFKCGAYGKADNLKEVILLSMEGDAKHECLVPSDFKKLSVVVGVIKDKVTAEEREEVDERFLVVGKEWLTWPQQKMKVPEGEDEDDEVDVYRINNYVTLQLTQEKPPKNVSPMRKILTALVVVFAVAVMLYLRYHDATYSVQWEDFYHSYGILGLDVGTPFTSVKKAYHRLSFRKHPDKLGSSCDQKCHEEWAKITDAYAAIRDYHSGKLKLLNPPTRFDPDF